MSSLTLPARVTPARARRPRPTAVVSAPVRIHPAAPTPALRLTRRGRVLVTLVLLVVAAAAVLLLRAPATASTGSTSHAPVARSVTVAPGQTLWEIAREARPGVDPRDTVDRIMEMNGLSSASVQAGRQLFVPAG
jgi:LysM repeat protein